jgi:2-amino-4-hydroxy-6-hydroxymethyldihydropteridine diphosphokinase
VSRIGHVGLGSNLGDRRGYLQAAVEDLWAHGVEVLLSSSVYETEPVGEVTDQPEFLNACVEVETGLDPEALLEACKAVEAALGRTPEGPGYVRHGPRPIDVDVLLLEGIAHESPRLRIPHPGLTTRRFVLVPLLEIAPDVEIPGVGRAADALAALGADQAVRRAGPPLDVRA